MTGSVPSDPRLGPPLALRGQVRYTGALAHSGYRLNALICSFTDAGNRARFTADEDAYAEAYGLDARERELLRNRDLIGMFRHGVNIYAVAKACVSFKGSLAELGAAMRAMRDDPPEAAR